MKARAQAWPRGPSRALLLFSLLAACNFDAAFSRYCQNNPNCKPDSGKDLVSSPSPDLRPDLAPDLRPDLAPDLSPDLAPDLSPDLMPDTPVWPGRPDSGGTRAYRNCTSPADCNAPMETCHPTALMCVLTCRSPSDCSLGLDTCEVRGQPGDSSPSARICACSNSLACGQMAPGFRCNKTDRLCQPPCYGAADCTMFSPARVCDPFSNTCVECVVSIDCSNRSDGRTECDSIGRCVRPVSGGTTSP